MIFIEDVENLATMVCETPLKRGMFVPNTQKRTPPRLDATLTTLVPETPPELRGLKNIKCANRIYQHDEILITRTGHFLVVYSPSSILDSLWFYSV